MLCHINERLILFVLRFGIYVSFNHKESTEIGVLFPGKSFVNGKTLLGEEILKDLLYNNIHVTKTTITC